MESAEKSEQVLRDVRITIGELVTDVFYTVLAQCAGEYDCRFSAECVSPTMVADGLRHYDKVDLPMGEFWLNSPTHDKLNDVLDAVSGAHIYGKNVIQAEGFTEIRGTWTKIPLCLNHCSTVIMLWALINFSSMFSLIILGWTVLLA